jgi:ribosomal subunit interface protein
MKIIIKTKNLSLNDEMESFIETKIGALDKFLGMLKREKVEKGKPLDEFFIEVEKETKHHRTGPYFLAKAYIHLPGKTLVAQSESDDIRTAIVDVKDEMQQELKKYKFKNFEAGRRKSRKIKEKLKGI